MYSGTARARDTLRSDRRDFRGEAERVAVSDQAQLKRFRSDLPRVVLGRLVLPKEVDEFLFETETLYEYRSRLRAGLRNTDHEIPGGDIVVPIIGPDDFIDVVIGSHPSYRTMSKKGATAELLRAKDRAEHALKRAKQRDYQQATDLYQQDRLRFDAYDEISEQELEAFERSNRGPEAYEKLGEIAVPLRPKITLIDERTLGFTTLGTHQMTESNDLALSVFREIGLGGGLAAAGIRAATEMEVEILKLDKPLSTEADASAPKMYEPPGHIMLGPVFVARM